MMKAILEVYRLNNDIVTTSTPAPAGCPDDCPCDFGCNTDFAQLGE